MGRGLGDDAVEYVSPPRRLSPPLFDFDDLFVGMATPFFFGLATPRPLALDELPPPRDVAPFLVPPRFDENEDAALPLPPLFLLLVAAAAAEVPVVEAVDSGDEYRSLAAFCRGWWL